MPFGPKNAPVLYTAMMQYLRDDWILLFKEIKKLLHQISHLHILCVTISVFTIFFHYDLLKTRVEYVDHDLTTNTNCPTASNFDLLQSGPLPPHIISLL